MAKMTPRTLSGFMELLPQPQQQMERMMDILRRTYSLYGFTPLDTPVIEASSGSTVAQHSSPGRELWQRAAKVT